MADSIFLDTINGTECSRPPVWFMRQAGRVLPAYNKLRKKYSFKELLTDPSLAAEVTLMPVHDLGVDAAILFSDILVIPEAMGMNLEFTDRGPVFEKALKDMSSENISAIRPDMGSLEYIYRNISKIVSQKPDNIPLIGFCGSPLTTMCYMIQGISSNHAFPDAVKFIYRYPDITHKLVNMIADISVEYANNQIDNGVQAFQLFETHAGLLPADLYEKMIIPAVKKISSTVRAKNIPLIFYPKGIGTGIKLIDHTIADVISLDWQQSLFTAREFVGQQIVLQGNLDPRLLTLDRKAIENHLNTYLDFGKNEKKWIFSLGHGLTPDIPFENARFVADWVRNTNWKRKRS